MKHTNITYRRIRKWLFRILFLWFTIHTITVVVVGTKCFDGQADVAIVLGNKVNEDGTLSDRLEARVNAALELYQKEKVHWIFVSGGVGKEGYDEAIKMKEYLVENAVPKEKIIVDSNGYTTAKTAENFAEYAAKHNLPTTKVVVVSQFYHILRTKLIVQRKLKEQNVEVKGYAPSYFEWKDLYSITREFFAYYYYLVFK